MHTEAFTLGAAPYPIRLAVPRGAAPAAGWPVLTLLGHDAFDAACALLRYHADCRAPGYLDAGVLVGVGDGGERRRRFDYTPALTPADKAQPSASAQGGADAFLHVLLHDVRSAVQARLPVDARRQSLAGHSLGGLFTLHTLFTQPDAFHSYIASSPSVWWGDGYLERQAKAWLAANVTLPAPIAVCISVGEYEQALSPLDQSRADAAHLTKVRAQRAMVDGNRRLAHTLATHPKLNLGLHVYPGQYHRSVWANALNLGLLTAFGKTA